MQKKTAASARGMNKNAPKETFVSVDGSTERKLVASQPRKMEVVWDLTEVADEEMVRTDTVKNKRQMKKLRNKKKREEAAAARMQTTEESEVDKQMTKAGGIKKDSEKQVHPKPKKMFAHKAVQTVVVPAGTLVKMMVSKSVQTEESVVESKSTKTRKTTDEEEEKEEKIPIDTTQQNVKPKKMTSAEALGLMSEGLEDEEMAQTESDVVEDNGEGNRNKRKKLDEEEELGEETSNKGKGFAFFERNGKGEEIKKEDMAKFDRIYKESEEDRQAREERWNEEHAIVLRENLVRGKKDIEELSDDDIFYIDGDAHQGSKVPKSRESVGDNVVGLSSIALSLSLTRDPTESTGSAAAVEALETPSARKRKVVRYFVDHDISSKCYRCGKIGHISAQCTEGEKFRPCNVCGLAGHIAESCLFPPCHRCLRQGHLFRNCRAAAAKRAICLDCGATDHTRAHCVFMPSEHDLDIVRCLSCGQVGHLNCQEQAEVETHKTPRVYCAKCGQIDHTYDVCNINPESLDRKGKGKKGEKKGGRFMQQRLRRKSY